MYCVLPTISGSFLEGTNIVTGTLDWTAGGISGQLTITNGATGPYVMRAGDPNLANVPAGGSIWTFKIFEEYSGPQRAASAN